jgi:hypothetical protein
MVSVLAPNTFVVDSSTLGANNLCRAVLGFRNLFNSGSSSASSFDSNYPLSLLYDNKTNTEYSPSMTSGSVQITLNQSVASTVNYIGIFSKNAGDCGLSYTVELLSPLTGIYEQVASGTNNGNAIPLMSSFKGFMSISQRVTISFTSKCFISTMFIGEAVVFGRTVSVGYQPGRNASMDEVSNFSTDGNNFIQGRRITNGYEEKAPINYQPYGFVDMWWREFMNHVLDSKPIFFMANNQLQNNCIFGLQNPQTLTKPSYKNSHHTDIDLEIRGWA